MARPRAGYEAITVYLPEQEARELKHYAVDERAGLSGILAEEIVRWWRAHPKRAQYVKPPER
jgi:hypothetical protein